MTKVSIKIKKFWFSDIAADGGLGTDWQEIQIGLREATVQFQGSDADITNHKNVLGNILASEMTKGDKTLVFQMADLDPNVIAEFAGGTVVEDADSIRYEAPLNENQNIEKSLRFLTEENILYSIPRASVDAYPGVNDDDLHYYQINTVLLLPEKADTPSYTYDVLKVVGANDIASFSIPEESTPATIDDVGHTVAVDVPAATPVTALVPTIGVSLGASVLPVSGEAQDFTTPVEYVVEAADGTKQIWTVTVTVLP
jgi:hypothetical protein